MTIFGDGKQVRAFSHIDDVAPYIAKSIITPAAKNQIINIGADQPYSVLELAQVIAKAMGVEPKLEFHPRGLRSSMRSRIMRKRRTYLTLIKQ